MAWTQLEGPLKLLGCSLWIASLSVHMTEVVGPPHLGRHQGLSVEKTGLGRVEKFPAEQKLSELAIRFAFGTCSGRLILQRGGKRAVAFTHLCLHSLGGSR